MPKTARRVLVIEDDPDVRDALLAFLVGLGYPAVGVPDGAHALELLEKGELPALILLDIMMPKMDGRAFRRRQLANPALARIPVIVITARPDEPRGEEFRAVHWMEKPFRANELKRILRELLP
jgi:two-component system response regulator MprA